MRILIHYNHKLPMRLYGSTTPTPNRSVTGIRTNSTCKQTTNSPLLIQTSIISYAEYLTILTQHSKYKTAARL